jgi:Ran GTPase-activating protein (RanGAP) involved in mRNA processing and transport
MSDSNDPTISTDNGVVSRALSSTFLEFCAKVRNNDPSILPEDSLPFTIDHMGEKYGMELASALMENTNVKNLELWQVEYTKILAEAMAKYVRTSKSLESLSWKRGSLKYCDDIVSCLLHAIQESVSLKELHIQLPCGDGPSNLAFENMLTHNQSLRSLTLNSMGTRPKDKAVAAFLSGLKNNISLRELTLEFSLGATTLLSPILTSLCDHTHLRKLCLAGSSMDLTDLETVLHSKNSKITEISIDTRPYGCLPMIGVTRFLQGLGRRPALTKLELRNCPLGHGEVRELRLALCNTPCLHSLVLETCTLGNTGLAELAPALYRNTSIKELDISENNLIDLKSAILLREVLRRNKTVTTLDLSRNVFGETNGAVQCIADGLGSNSTLLKIDLSRCALGDDGVSTLARSLGSQNVALQKLSLVRNLITSTGIGMLLETMEQSCRITDLDLESNDIGDEGASLLAMALANSVLPNLTRLSLNSCGIGDDGFIELVSALEQNASLLQLDLRQYHDLSDRAFLALAESLPEIKVLQRLDLHSYTGLASIMPLLLTGLQQNTSLLRCHVDGCAPNTVQPTPEDMTRCAGGWMQEMERLGYRNCFLRLIRAPKERLPPCGIWSHALTRVTILPDVIFEVLCSKPSLVPSEETGGKVAAKNTSVATKRKRGDK